MRSFCFVFVLVFDPFPFGLSLDVMSEDDAFVDKLPTFGRPFDSLAGTV